MTHKPSKEATAKRFFVNVVFKTKQTKDAEHKGGKPDF